jgi:hypothetical protein
LIEAEAFVREPDETYEPDEADESHAVNVVLVEKGIAV